MNKFFPEKLKIGDKIGVIAPSSPVSLPDDSIRAGHSFLRDKGFKIFEHSQMRTREGYLAGSIKERVDAIHDLFFNKNIRCIMAFWGGWNSNHLLDYLDYELIKNNPKIFIGYSDVTALSTAITEKTGLITYSGPGMISYIKPNFFHYTWEYFEKVCVLKNKKVTIKHSYQYADDLYFLSSDPTKRKIKKNPGIAVFRHGQAEGEIIVGNLQTLLVLCGTGYFPSFSNKILILEESEDATVAMVDRFLTQMKQIGIFDRIKGLIFGRFMSATGFSSDDELKKMFTKMFDGYRFPVIYNLNYGHTDPIITVPNGGYCWMETRDKKITFQTYD